MRILYFGDPRALLGLLNFPSGLISLCGIIHGRSGGEGSRTLATILKKNHLKNIPRWRLPNLEHSDVQDALAETQPQLIVSAFYPRRIPQEILDLAPGINVHPSRLPQWRGPDPAFWVIHEQESETAITIHRLSDQLDEGNILYQEKIRVGKRESGGALAVRLERRAAQIMVKYVKMLAMDKMWHTKLEGQPQEGLSSWAPLMDPNDLEVDWQKSAFQIDALVRAAAPDPCAFSGLGNELMVIHRGRVGQLSSPLSEQERSFIPVGQAFIDDKNCYIRCGEGFYQLNDVTIGRRRLKGEKLALLLGAQLKR